MASKRHSLFSCAHNKTTTIANGRRRLIVQGIRGRYDESHDCRYRKGHLRGPGVNCPTSERSSRQSIKYRIWRMISRYWRHTDSTGLKEHSMQYFEFRKKSLKVLASESHGRLKPKAVPNPLEPVPIRTHIAGFRAGHL